MAEEELKPIIEAINDLATENTLPKNVRIKLEYISEILGDETDMSIKINKVLQDLEEISDDSNLQAFNRTQIWNLISLLESI